MNRREAIAGLSSLTLFGLGGCNPFPASCRISWTVTIATPRGIRTGSSVIGIWAREQIPIGMAPPYRFDFYGEAIVFAIERNLVFATMGESLASTLIRAVLPDMSAGGDMVAKVRRIRDLAREERSFRIPPENYPSLVSFEDRDRPETIKPVCLQEREIGTRCDIRVVNATATPTRDAVTERIESYLPWVTKRGGSMVQTGWESERTPEQNYTITDFKRLG